MDLTRKIFMATLSVATVLSVQLELATIKEASQSTMEYNYVASNAIDKDEYTFSMTKLNVNETAWFRVELTQKYFVLLVRLIFWIPSDKYNSRSIRLTNSFNENPSLENTESCSEIHIIKKNSPINFTCEDTSRAYKFVVLIAPLKSYIFVMDIKIYGYPEGVSSTILSTTPFTTSSTISTTTSSTISTTTLLTTSSTSSSVISSPTSSTTSSISSSKTSFSTDVAPVSTAYILQAKESLIPLNMWTILSITLLGTLAICPPIIYILLMNVQKFQRGKELDKDEENDEEDEKEEEEDNKKEKKKKEVVNKK